MIKLGVNVDHVATLREARKGEDPDVLEAAKLCEMAGAHQITAHLRQDRRHMQDQDIELLAELLEVPLNFEMAAVPEIIAIAHRIRPYQVCLVPENRQEITTEGGLDVAGDIEHLRAVTQEMHAHDIQVSLFIDPDQKQVNAAAQVGADCVELHTGPYANAHGDDAQHSALQALQDCGRHVLDVGLILNAGHGLTVHNLAPVAQIPGLNEVNIGHAIIARAIFIGLDEAVHEILDVLEHYDED